MGYAFAEAPAIYGVVTAIFTGERVLALPFAAVQPAATMAEVSRLAEAAILVEIEAVAVV